MGLKFCIGSLQFCARGFAAALETHSEVLWLRPGFIRPLIDSAGALAFLRRMDEARAMLARLRASVPNDMPRLRDRPRWVREEDWNLLLKGLRRASAPGVTSAP